MPADSPLIRLIVVEDNPPDILLLEECLNEFCESHELTQFSDGQQALEGIENGEWLKARPHAIILDLNVPKINGIEVLTRVKADQQLKNVPVIVLTSSMAPDERETAQQLGVTLYVRKPVDLDDFLNEVGAALRAVVNGAQ